jgi:hypothetical protein
MRQLITMLSAAALLMLIASAAGAQQASTDRPCKADIERLCKDAKLGQGGLHCLQENQDQLSQACKDSLKSYVESAVAACRDDAKRLCKDVKLGQGRKIRCLQEHEEKISQACKDSLKQM